MNRHMVMIAQTLLRTRCFSLRGIRSASFLIPNEMIILSTVEMYIWMVKKMWTGDLLHGKSHEDKHL